MEAYTDYDQVLKKIGYFGRYQMFVLILAFYCTVLLLFNIMFMNFGALVPQRKQTEVTDQSFNLNLSEGVHSLPVNVSLIDQIEKNEAEFESAVTEWHLLGEESKHIPYTINSIQMLGFMVGGVIAGQVCDSYGRKTAWLTGSLCLCVTGAGTGLVPNWHILAAVRLLMGIACAIQITSILIFLGELSTKSHRLWLIAFYMTGEVGSAVLAATAYATMNWRHTALIGNLLFIPALISLNWVYESPRWLIHKNREYQLHKVLCAIAKRNKREWPPVECEKEASLTTNVQELEQAPSSTPPRTRARQLGWGYLLGTPVLLVRLVAISLVTMVVFSMYYQLLFSTAQLVGNVYITTAVYGLVKVLPIALIIALDRYTNMGRRLFLGGSLLLLSACLLAKAMLDLFHPESYMITVIQVCASCFILPAFITCFLYPIELFPTLVRSRGAAVSSCCGRVGTIVAPLFMYLRVVWPPLPPLIMCGACLAAALIAFTALPETRGKPLPEAEHLEIDKELITQELK